MSYIDTRVSIYDINKVANSTAIILIKILNLFALNLLCAFLFEVFGIYLFSIAHITEHFKQKGA